MLHSSDSKQQQQCKKWKEMSKGKMADAVFLPRRVPQWVDDLVKEHDGYDLRFMLEKPVEKTDLSNSHSRLFIKKDYLDAHIIPCLETWEKEAASLLDPHPKKKVNVVNHDNNNIIMEEMKRKKVAGRVHGGLRVPVFTRNRWRHMLELTRWDGSAGTVLKGKEWNLARAFSGFDMGDVLMMWGFRRGPTKELCFVIANKRTMCD